MIRALGFLTVVGRGEPPTSTTLRWFPVVGLLLGLAVGGAWWATNEAWPLAVAAALTVAVDLALTGMLHLDGLADTADGVLPHLDRPRRLAVMAQPDVGAFGVGIVVLVLLLRWSAFASRGPCVLLVAGIWCASRTLMAVAARTLPYARREGGLASAFATDGRRDALAIGGGGLVLALGAGVLGDGGVGALSVGAAILGGAGVLALGRARLGGFTGDVLGAAGLVGETVGLLVAAAKW